MFIVIEGQDATGKDTQAAKLVEYFKSQGKNVVHYSESGTNSDNPFVQGIAKLNYGSHDSNIDPRTRVLLYLVNRYEQWKKIAEPALKNDDVVIITRNWLSTVIYEGYGTGVSRQIIAKLHHDMLPDQYFKPDKIVILTLSDEERAKRLISQGKRSEEFFKSKDGKFQKKLNDAYLKVAKQYNIPTFDTAGTPDEVFERLKKFWKI